MLELNSGGIIEVAQLSSIQLEISRLSRAQRDKSLVHPQVGLEGEYHVVHFSPIAIAVLDGHSR